VVRPGTTRTERTAPRVTTRAAARGVAPRVIEDEMAACNPIRHWADASEVADVVAFLCSPRSRAINGDGNAVGGGAPRSIHY
jgi:NAD(P)-dependent dehydrogenase (short-subunit alcohol dehydrogenase family)